MTDASTATSHDRHIWLDSARGIGIILVVYGHQLRAQTFGAGMLPGWHASLQIAVIYTFHMPLFFVLSGIVSLKSIQRRPYTASFVDKLKTIAYPYFLWSIVSWCLSSIAASYVNSPMTLEKLLSITYEPILQYWFLYVLFMCQMVALLFRRYFVGNLIVAAILLIMPLHDVGVSMREFAWAFPFFAVGMAISAPTLASRNERSALAATAAALSALVIFVLAISLRSPEAPFSRGIALVQAWSGIALVLLVARAIGPRWAWLPALGRASMAVFVLHTIVAAAFRTAIGLSGLHSPALTLVVCVLGGLLVPVLIVRAGARYGLEAWFGLGKSDRSVGDVTARSIPLPYSA